MSGCVGLQFAGPPAAWRSVSAGGLVEGSAVRDELGSEPPHPASMRTNKDAASAYPGRILFSRATMSSFLDGHSMRFLWYRGIGASGARSMIIVHIGQAHGVAMP